MVEPLSTLGLVFGKAAAGKLGSFAGGRMLEWADSNEARRLVKLLKKGHPAARQMLLQPDVLAELWLYAETGDLDEEALTVAVRPITASDDEAAALVAGVRDLQWRAARDDRRTHFEILRLRAEVRRDVEAQAARILERLDVVIARLGSRLPAARQLPAATDRFVDRETELRTAEDTLDAAASADVARILCFDGMPGIGKSTLAIEIARRYMTRFDGGVLYVDLRTPGGAPRSTAEVAARLLRDLGVAADTIQGDDGSIASLRSLLAGLPVLLVLDNAVDEAQVRELVPANPDSVVLITARTPLAALGLAKLMTLQKLAATDAVDLLAGFVGNRAATAPAAATAIAEACHGLPLAVSVVGARMGRRPERSLEDFAGELDGTLDSLDDPADRIAAALTSGVNAVSHAARRTLLLAAALDVVEFSAESFAAITGLSRAHARDVLEELEDCRLVGPEGLHQLVRALLRSVASEELEEHDVTSAQERRVRWLVESAQPYIDGLAG